MTSGILSIGNTLLDVQVSFKSKDASNQHFDLLIESHNGKITLSILTIFCKYAENKKTGGTSIIIKSPEIQDIITITFQTPEVTKKMYEFIISKSDVHHTNEMMDSLDRAIESAWPFPGGLVN